MNILHIDCSPRLESHSRRLSAAIVEELLKVSPAADITRRDLGAAPLPHAAADYATTLSSPVTLSAPLEGALDLAEALIQEVEAADVIIIGTPMHNLTIPSVLKAWIDQILRVGRTMMSTPAGKVGMLDDRPVFIGIASGGTFTGARANQPDFLTPYLSEVLGSIGLKSLQFLSVQATAFLEGEAAAGAREKVLAAIDLSLVDPIASKVPERLCDRGEEIVAVSRKDGVDTVTGEALANASVVTDVSHFPSSEAAADLGLLKPEERVQRPASRMRRADTEQHCNGR